MNNWILARGREAELCLPDVTPAGARSLALAGAGAAFAPPQKIFISEADGSETEWLGRVTQATSAALSFSRPLRASKNGGARIWRPAAALEFPPDSIRPERRATVPGVAAERTPAGTVYAIQTAEPQTSLRLVFEDLAATAEDALILWLAGLRWGLDPFTLLDPGGRLAAVRLTGDPVLQERDAAGRRRFILTLAILQEGACS